MFNAIYSQKSNIYDVEQANWIALNDVFEWSQCIERYEQELDQSEQETLTEQLCNKCKTKLNWFRQMGFDQTTTDQSYFGDCTNTKCYLNLCPTATFTKMFQYYWFRYYWTHCYNVAIVDLYKRVVESIHKNVFTIEGLYTRCKK